MILRKESYHQEHEKLLNYITYRKALVVSLMSIHSSLEKVTPAGGGGYSEFQVTGLIEGFGLEFSIPGFLGGRKIWQVFFWGGLIYKIGFWGGFKTI